jgi:hypothetical protein
VKRSTRTALIFAGAQLAVAIVATAARKLGYIDSDTVIRVMMAALGLMLVFSANSASKAVAPSARGIANQRFLAWSMTLGALIWTGCWAFAPLDVAGFIAMAAVALGVIVPVLYCIASKTRPAA